MNPIPLEWSQNRGSERLIQLNRVAITQMKSLVDNRNLAKQLN